MTSPLKWHGGKGPMATRIAALFPPCLHYVEPYAGGLSVLLARNPEGVSEVVNDISQELTNFWTVLRCDATFPAFLKRAETTPFSESIYNGCSEFSASLRNIPREEFEEQIRSASVYDRVMAAWDFFVHCRQSLAGRMDAFAPLSRTRTRRGMNEQASAWLSAVEGLPAVHARLKRVVVLNRDALDVIRQQDGKDTLFYCDPPYMSDTRTAPDVYAHEMTKAQHADLLATLGDIKGKFALSGYRSMMYDHDADTYGWHRTDFDVPNHAAGGAAKRRMVECVWTNFQPARAS